MISFLSYAEVQCVYVHVEVLTRFATMVIPADPFGLTRHAISLLEVQI